MAKLHLTPSGQARKCSAQPGQCLYRENGVDPEHYATKEEAHTAYEKKMANLTVSSTKKNVPVSAFVQRVTEDVDKIFKDYNKETVLTEDEKKQLGRRIDKGRKNIVDQLDRFDKALKKSGLSDEDIQSFDTDVKNKRKIVAMANDALAILSEDTRLVPRSGITVSDYTEPNIVDDFDENGNTRYKGVDVIQDSVKFDDVNYTRLSKDVYASEPYSFRIQVGKEMDTFAAKRLSELVAYEYTKTGGERGNFYHQDSPNSIIFYADTTKGRAYNKLDTFVSDLPKTISEGSPVRKTDRAGANTAGTRLVDGLGNMNYCEIYADAVFD